MDGERLSQQYGLAFYGEIDPNALRTVGCWEDIADLDEVLVAAGPISEDRWRAYQRGRVKASKPVGGPAAADLLDGEIRWVEDALYRGTISGDAANLILAARHHLAGTGSVRRRTALR